MKASFVSTSAMSEATRLSLMKLQVRLAEAQKEVSTGRLADVGASLGYKAGQTVSLRQEHTRLQTIIETNGIVATRLDATQETLKTVAGTAENYFQQLMGARNGGAGVGADVLREQALAGLADLTHALNTSSSGTYLLAGINGDVKPIADYQETPPSASKVAVDNAFFAAFGITQSDPAVANISATAMQNFLDTDVAGLFDATNWSSTWSAASDQNVRSRISTSELIETSANANDAAVRKLASAFTMVANLGIEKLNQPAFQAVVDTAVRSVREAIDGLTGLRAGLGTAQARVSNANDRMSLQVSILATHITAFESVDPYEAATRLSSLTTQIETAYAITARIQKLSLLNYL